MRGGPAGRGLRGGPGGIDFTSAPPEFRFFRRSDTGGATGQIYVPGLNETARIGATDTSPLILGKISINAQDPTAGERLIAVPEVFPRSARIVRVLQYVDSALGFPATNKIRCGIYDDAGLGNPYPQNLLWDSGDVAITAIGLKEVPVSPALGVAAGSLLWFVLAYSEDVRTNDVNFRMAVSGSLFPILGMQRSELSAPLPRLGCGWRHDQAYGAMPTTFPTSAPSRNLCMVNADTPVWCYGAEILG